MLDIDVDCALYTRFSTFCTLFDACIYMEKYVHYTWRLSKTEYVILFTLFLCVAICKVVFSVDLVLATVYSYEHLFNVIFRRYKS